MNLQINFYAFSHCDCTALNDYFIEFKNTLAKEIEHFSELDIINGNDKFKNTYHFIDYLIKLNTEIDFDNLCRILRNVSENNMQFIRDNFPKVYKFIEDNNDINEIPQSLKMKTLICLKGRGLKFKGQPSIHGLSEANGKYAVVIESYKNIVWHEAAHLFGADDHYINKDVYQMDDKCTNKELCIMQYDPGHKLCSFCLTALKEIRDNMFKGSRPLHISDLLGKKA